jgi:L-alanine-DL-glutamate epimerase-like enolase superfamily enzyme
MVKIKSFETWVCRQSRGPQYEGQGHKFSETGQVVLIKISDDEGFAGISTCLAELSTQIPLSFLHEFIAPRLVGRNVYDREGIWLELWRIDRHLIFWPLYITGPVDVALWDLAAKRAGLPLYQYIGAARTSLPVYYSSQFMDTLEDYIVDVKRCLAMGLSAYKVHSKDDFEVFAAVRETAGPDLVLMADVADDWTFEKALRLGRYLESLNYYWLEEPFKDWNVEKYARLAAALDLPIAGTEATRGGPWGVAQAIARQAIDIVRADVSWKSGVTGTLKIAHLAEAFGMNCEMHCTLMGPMDIANLHVSCAIGNCEYFELHMPEQVFQFPMKEPYPIDDQGMIHVPQRPGLGIDLDWDAVDDTTHQRLSTAQ